ncbi:MAG: pantetheine-phosphate adenylyltransferase [Acidobacteriota bacterium]
MSTKRIVVYPGSFDPIHYGHLDVIERSCSIFDEVVVAVLSNTSKQPLFSVDERVDMIGELLADADNCRVETFSGLLVDFMRSIGARTSIRGLRAVSDFESEFQMALMNRRLDSQVDTVFLTSKEDYSYLSSRLVKEVFLLGGSLDGLVPPPVWHRMQEQFPARPDGSRERPR